MGSILEGSIQKEPVLQPVGATSRRWVWVGVGILALLIFLLTPSPHALKPAAWHTLGILLCSVIWWVTEALPIPVTAMTIFLFLDLSGVMSLKKAVVSGFGSPLLIFMLGALTLSVAFQITGLSKRITSGMLRISGTRTVAVVGAFFWGSFVISMFITDVAVVAMMLPPALALLKSLDLQAGKSNLGKALMMAVMFGATEGGATTPAGVSANVATSGILEKSFHIHISFLHWFAIATPLYVAMGLLSWWLILKIFRPEMSRIDQESYLKSTELEDKKWKRGEISTAVIFAITVILWLFGSSLFHVDKNIVALLAFGLLFLPGLGVFNGWKKAELGIEWGAILLIVAGVTLGAVAVQTGLAAWVAQNALAPFSHVPLFLQPFLMNVLVAVDSIPLSNLGASASINVPFIAMYAQNFHFPVFALAMAAGLSSASHYILVTESPSFVLPYAYGYFNFRDFAKIGVLVTILGGLLISLGMLVYGMPAA